MPRVLLAVVVAFIASGCATTTTEVTQLRGHYTWGHEVRTFRACGSTQSFWVVGDTAVLRPLQERSAALASSRGKPYQPIYVEVSAVAQGKATDGFAADYEGVYRFVSVQAVDSLSPADCQAEG